MKRNSRLIVLVTTAAVIVAIAGLGFLIGSPPATSATPSTNLAEQAANSECAAAQPIHFASSSSGLVRPVLLLQPNSSVYVCVTYQAGWASAENYTLFRSQYFANGTLNFHAGITNTVRLASCGCYSYTVSHAFSVTIQPGAISPSPDLTSVTILYTITPLANTTGFYDGFSPAPGALISVGYNASQVNPSDFPYAGLVHPGGLPQPYVPVKVAVSGVSVVYITVPSLFGR